ncbi:ABC transporter ATP-binding protein [Dyadobacter alkalitolerans]|uniref:ABC transporter ATP-binding protein n=1 Tax=Dyadobacter alkalitolerans TaxID=492736 RepID=UPI00042A29DD|nr:ABC transporter ATP-binding protein [Dyadobacter alkalitolerans]
MKPAIRVDKICKQYRLGDIGTGTLSNDLKRWWYEARGKEDPFLKIGERNDRTTKSNSDYVWALSDISFQVMPGEIMGIIGKNGAGKSTLLKILSKVTSATTGRIDFDGRIGSMLEVGTGFHPELTGMENIYLNGAILGMTKAEIRSKLDEIIDFSGCERYINTPVKRYSSGMTVRLGFAVAAHLEPEILVIDEVLAVGDAEFQKKAIGKMQDVSRNEGRTVLFVSHNLGAIRNLCTHSIILDKGEMVFDGSTDQAITHYLQSTTINKSDKISSSVSWHSEDIEIDSIEINESEINEVLLISGQNTLVVRVRGMLRHDRKMSIAASINDEEDCRVATYDPAYLTGKTPVITKGAFDLEAVMKFPPYMNKGTYKLNLYLVYAGVEYLMKAPDCAHLQIEGYMSASGNILDSRAGGIMFLEQ